MSSKYDNYIKLCAAAKQIQALWTPNFGDVYYQQGITPSETMMISAQAQIDQFKKKRGGKNYLRAGVTWIPDLGQLVDIYARHMEITSVEALIALGNFIVEEEMFDKDCVFKTPEEVAMVLVMSDVFKKDIMIDREAATNKILALDWVVVK
jgi:hypothetical protein